MLVCSDLLYSYVSVKLILSCVLHVIVTQVAHEPLFSDIFIVWIHRIEISYLILSNLIQSYLIKLCGYLLYTGICSSFLIFGPFKFRARCQRAKLKLSKFECLKVSS